MSDCDVLVIGAGPAGAAAAHLLASWGRSVIVAHRASTAPSLAESLPPSIRKLLALVGQLDAVDAASFYPNEGNLATWAGEARETTSRDAGFHVSRHAFDAVLRAGTRAAGAHVIDAAVRGVDGGDPIRATCALADGSLASVHARYVLDCSGRTGVVARRGLRRVETRYRTLAIVAEWECPGWPASERRHTTVESYADGWAWSVPLSDTRRQCTVMTGARVVSDSCQSGARLVSDTYGRELAKTAALSARLEGARQVSRPWACDASLYDSSRAADGRTLLVGDAASFIEPLSSAGVKKALLSAWRAAVVANTCLADTTMAGAAIDLYIERERQVHADCLRQSSRFFAEAARVYATPFWSARAAACGANDDTAADDGDVRTTFERLRSAPHVRLRPSRAMRFEPAPAIEGRRVVMRDAVVIPGCPTPLQFSAGVDLPALARLAGDGGDVPSLVAAYQARVAAAPAGGVLAGLSLLVARHALVTEDPRS